MKHYAIAFVGLGSIGTRHFCNVINFLENRGDTYNIDLYRSDLNRPLSDEILQKVDKQYLYADPIPSTKYYDIVFVTNPTSLHYDTIHRFCKSTKSFFVEKPVFDSTFVDESIFTEVKDLIAYVACPLRYNPVLLYVKDNVNFEKVISARAMSSSYLPDWRKGQDYRKCYSAHRDMGGGVAIDLIHEWDYLTSFFGIPKTCYSLQGKNSDLEIDSDDYAVYIAKTDKTVIELHLDYFGRKTMRTLDLFMNEETIHCDIVNGKIEFLKEGKAVDVNAERNAFQMKEIEHFFAIVDGAIPNDSDMKHAFNVLKLAKGDLL